MSPNSQPNQIVATTVNPLVAEVKSDLEQQVAVHVAEQDKISATKALIQKRVAAAKRKFSGQLDRAEYEKLKDADKRAYRRAFGIPASPVEIRAAKAKKAKKSRRNKIASKSRARNR